MNSDPHRDPALDRRETYSYKTDRGDQHHFTERSSQTHAAFFIPYLRPGMALVDCGCGPGTITVDLAAQVAPGHVLGIDIDATSLAKAQELATARGLSNVRFQQASIYAIPCEDASVDAVFIHGVLHHLAEPATALREAQRVLKPGGMLGVRDPDFGGHIIGPVDNPMHELYQLWATMIQRNGGHPYLGRELRGLLHAAGCEDIIATASYETHGTPATVAFLRASTAVIEPKGSLGSSFLALGLIDEASLATLKARIVAWCDSPGAFLARPWCEAVGWKP